MLELALTSMLLLSYSLGSTCWTECGWPASESQSRQTVCPLHTADSILLTEETVGGIPTNASFAVLRRLCPGARDTLLLGESEDTPGAVFSFPSFTAVAIQWEPKIVEEDPPDEWIMEGEGWLLANGLSAPVSWWELRSALGKPSGSADLGEVWITFCDMPRWSFMLDADPSLLDHAGIIRDFTSIPETAKIVRIGLEIDDVLLPNRECLDPKSL